MIRLNTPALIYRVILRERKSGKWTPYTNFHNYSDAELAAWGLVTGGKASQCHVLELGKGEPRIVAYVHAEPAPGWPHGRATVRKV